MPTSAFFSLRHCQERHAYRFSYRSRKSHRCHLSFITRQRKILPIWAESTQRIRQLINQSTEIAHRPILLTQFTEVCRKVRKTRCRQSSCLSTVLSMYLLVEGGRAYIIPPPASRTKTTGLGFRLSDEATVDYNKNLCKCPCCACNDIRGQGHFKRSLFDYDF